jgi:hypothetical protein
MVPPHSLHVSMSIVKFRLRRPPLGAYIDVPRSFRPHVRQVLILRIIIDFGFVALVRLAGVSKA